MEDSDTGHAFAALVKLRPERELGPLARIVNLVKRNFTFVSFWRICSPFSGGGRWIPALMCATNGLGGCTNGHFIIAFHHGHPRPGPPTHVRLTPMPCQNLLDPIHLQNLLQACPHTARPWSLPLIERRLVLGALLVCLGC